MELNSDFIYLCRICAHSTSNKHSFDSVSIIRTQLLQHKIQKYLDITVTEDDLLPKFLCKTCFRKIESIDSLSKIGKETQKNLENVISDAQKRPFFHIAAAAHNHIAKTAPLPRPVPVPDIMPVPVPKTAPLTAEQRQQEIAIMKQKIHAAVTGTPMPIEQMKPPAAKPSAIIDLSSGSKHKDVAAVKMRRPSLDVRFAPKSIAQRSMPTTASTTQKQLPATDVVAPKLTSPPAFLKFFSVNTTPPQPILTNATSSRVPSSSNAEFEESAANIEKAKLVSKNIRNALCSLKPVNPGQVSLLKASQKPIVAADKISKKQKMKQQHNFDLASELPEHPIVANPKVPKQPKPMQSTQATTAATTAPPLVLLPNHSKKKTAGTAIANKYIFAEELTLGSVIKDADFQRLILKTLKWDVTEANYETQLTRLKETSFTEIMNNTLLWQDADLTQLFSSYLAPHKQSQVPLQPVAETLPTSSSPPATAANNVLASVAPFKLPPDTSVKLVPGSPERDENASSQQTDAVELHKKLIAPVKRARRSPKSKAKTDNINLIEISDDDDDEQPRRANNQTIDPQIIEKLQNLKEQQLADLHRQKRFKMSLESTISNGNVDMNLIDTSMHDALPPTSAANNSVNALSSYLPIDMLMQGITRPIIKRRRRNKSKISVDKNCAEKANETVASSAVAFVPPPPSPVVTEVQTIVTATPETTASSVDVSNASSSTDVTVAAVVADTAATPIATLTAVTSPSSMTPDQVVVVAPDTPVSACSSNHNTSNEVTPDSSEPPTASNEAASTPSTVKKSKSSNSNRRSKSIIGQKLLAAIGSTETLNKTAAQQQIVATMRLSLKEKHEQNRKKEENSESIIRQDADSTTKVASQTSSFMSPSDRIINAIAKEIRNDIEKENSQLKQIEQSTQDESSTNMDISAQGDAAKKSRKTKKSQITTSESITEATSDSELKPRAKRGRKTNLERLRLKQEAEQKAAVEAATTTATAVILDTASNLDTDDESEPLANLKLDASNTSMSKRGQRTSKTLSKYYKGPDKSSSSRSLPTRNTRNRN